MTNRTIQAFSLFLTGLIASPSLAHTGVHNSSYHPLSGVDHFLAILMISLLVGVVSYYFYKK